MNTYLIKMSICWGALYLLYFLLFSKTTHFRINRFYLLGSLMAGLILPWLNEHLQGLWWQWNIQGATGTPVAALVDWRRLPEVLILANSTQQPLQADAFGIPTISLIYLAGVLTFFLRLVYGLFHLWQLRATGDIRKCPTYTLVIHQRVTTPFSFLKTIYLSPDQLEDKGSLQSILRHEEAHIRQYHSLDVLGVMTLQVFFWFNPLIYCYQRSLRNVHEYLADAAVLQTTARRDYGRLLLGQVQQPAQEPALVNHFFHSQLKKRIIMMTKKPSTNGWQYALSLPLILALSIFFYEPVLAQQPAQQEQPTASKTPEKEETFKVVEQMPRFPGPDYSGLSEDEAIKAMHVAMFTHMGEHLKFPKEAKEHGIQGTVVIRFVIDKEGNLTDASIVREIGGGCGEAALQAVLASPQWEPGLLRGKPVNVEMAVPVRFKIDNEQKVDSATAKEVPGTPSAEHQLAVDGFFMNPNPARDKLQLRFKAPQNSTTIRLISPDGREVFREHFAQFSGHYDQLIELGQLAAGNYYLQIVQGDKRYVKQLAIQ